MPGPRSCGHGQPRRPLALCLLQVILNKHSPSGRPWQASPESPALPPAPLALSPAASVVPATAGVDADEARDTAPLSLGQLAAGSRATILSLAADRRLLQRFDALGLRPGQQVEVLRRGWLSGILHLRVGMTELMLRRTGALAILVLPLAR